MASYQEHINQANNNLQFLQKVSCSIQESWDWQVTVCFYAAVHIINAHIAHKANQHYRSHELVSDAISPWQPLSPARLEEHEFYPYRTLQNLSRRSRYLISDDKKNQSTDSFLTFDKHFAKAIKNLDELLSYMEARYGSQIKGLIEIECIELESKASSLKYFKVIKSVKK